MDAENMQITGTSKIDIGVGSNGYNIQVADNTSLSTNSTGTSKTSTFIGCINATFDAGVENSVIIGGDSLTATNSGTVYIGNFVNINNAYFLPNSDGSTDQVLKTDGMGNSYWGNITDTGVTASNGLTYSGSDLILGGTLTQNTTINGSQYTLAIGDVGSEVSSFTVYTSQSGGFNFYRGNISDGTYSVIRNDNSGMSFTQQRGGSGGGNGVFTDVNYAGINTIGMTPFPGAITSIQTTFDGFTVGDGSSDNHIYIQDDISSKGLVYYDDYSANFTTHSVITKGYLENRSSLTLCEFYNDGSSIGTGLTTLYTTSGLVDTSNMLSVNGDKFKGSFGGYYTGATASTKSVHLYYGGNDLFGSVATAYESPSYWRIEFSIIRSNSSQIRYDVMITIYDTINNTSKVEQVSGAYGGFDFTTDGVIEVRGQSIGGGSADGDIVSRVGHIEFGPAKI